jgi:hypothetical protein
MSFGLTIWGAGTWGGCPEYVVEAMETGPAYAGMPLKLIIRGHNYTSLLLTDTLTISEELNSRSVLQFGLYDDVGLCDFEPGIRVDLYLSGSQLLFSGTIESVTESLYSDTSGARNISVVCSDWTFLCDRHLVFATYSTTSFAAAIDQIVRLDSGEVNERLIDEGIVVDDFTAPLEPVIQSLKFDGVTVTNAFSNLAELTGYVWVIDYNKRLRFVDSYEYVAPVDLCDNTFTRYTAVEVTKEVGDYRNIQTIRGGDGITSLITEEFSGDGEKKTFTLSHRIDSGVLLARRTAPAGYTTINTAVVSHKQDDVDSAVYEWYYEVGQDTISQSTADDDEGDPIFPPLTSSQQLRVQYHGRYSISYASRLDTEVTKRKRIEGGTGVYEQLEDATDITDEDVAMDRVKGLLSRYGSMPVRISFTTDLAGFKCGQRLPVNLPAFRLKDNFLITRVSAQCIGDQIFQYGIEAIGGVNDGGWAEFYRKLLRSKRREVDPENDALYMLRAPRSGLIIGDSVSTSDPLPDLDDDFASYWRIGRWSVGGVRGSTALNYSDRDGVVYGAAIGWPQA